MPTAAACDASLRIVSLAVLNADGTRAGKATVKMWRVRDGRVVLKRAPVLDEGIFELARDGGGEVREISAENPSAAPKLRGVRLTTKPQRFIAEVRSGKQVRRVPQTLALDARGCHVTRISGVETVTLR